MTAILIMPQIKLERSYDLVEVLPKLGLATLFGPTGDFSGISDEPGFGIDGIKHDSYLYVDEIGTEAAAVTLIVHPTGMPLPEPEWITLTIDRPFLFAIVEKTPGVILFLGKIEH